MTMTNAQPGRMTMVLRVAILAALGTITSAAAAFQEAATPSAFSLCAVVPPGASPAAEVIGMSMGTPESILPMDEIEFDLVFIDMMIAHHESAVVMAQVALERAEHDEIRRLAGEIIAAQTDEIAQLRAWRLAWYPSTQVVPPDQAEMIVTRLMGDMLDMSDFGSSNLMSGMDTSSALISMCQAAEPFDLAFLNAMIAHHQSAITMANIGLENSTHPDLQTLKLDIIDAQQAEIDEMTGWRALWYGVATPMS